MLNVELDDKDIKNNSNYCFFGDMDVRISWERGYREPEIKKRKGKVQQHTN